MKPAPPLVGLYNGPSRMRGNSHVRFLGEGAAATPLSYPTELHPPVCYRCADEKSQEMPEQKAV